jgi:aminopeptidase N
MAICRLLALLLGAGLLVAPGPRGHTYADDVGAKEVSESARKKAISGLGKSLGKLARDPRLARKMDEVTKIIDSLEALGGPEAGLAALKGVGITDEATRERLFVLLETVQDKRALKPLLALLENKQFRRDPDLKRRVAHALAVLADDKAIEPLSDLIRYDEDAEVVAEAADALAVFATATVEKKRIGVRRMVDLYGSTYNLMKSVRVEDKLQVKRAAQRWKVYARSLRGSLQAMTGRQLTKPQEWRRWWNDCKKSKDWSKCSSSAGGRR